MSNHIFNTNKRELKQVILNDINGFDDERIVSSHLTLALNCRISWASRKEDNAKVDLLATIQHPWFCNKIDFLFVQVKSGSSFAEVIETDDKTTLKIERSKFKEYLKNNQTIFVCWVNRSNHELYWFLIKSNSSEIKRLYNPIIHKLSPASRYDTVRLLNSMYDKNGGKGLFFTEFDYDFLWYDDEIFLHKRKKAKKIYNALKLKQVENPLLGKIEVTRFGWRHMTRTSRALTHEISSYNLIGLLERILSVSPSRHYIQSSSINTIDDYISRKVEYIFEYNNITCVFDGSKEKVKVFVKIMEIIRYPSDWVNCTTLSNKIKRRVIFRSIYYKKRGVGK